jgi:hypothetical protein
MRNPKTGQRLKADLDSLNVAVAPWDKERPPVFGMIQRCGQVVINLLANVKQKTIEPYIKETIAPGTLVYTDEYSIYARCGPGDTTTRVSTMDGASTPEMKMATAFVKSM